MRVAAVIQARLASSRLPAKLALDIDGKPLLARVADRLRLAAGIDAIVVATSDRPEDDITVALAERCGLATFRGSLEDAQHRFLGAADAAAADIAIRVTADNPYTEPGFIEELIAARRDEPSRPYIVHDLRAVVYGTASELIDVEALRRIVGANPSAFDREHITPSLRADAAARVLAPSAERADPRLSLTVDTLEDYAASVRLHQAFGTDRDVLARIVAAHRAGTLPAGATRLRETA